MKICYPIRKNHDEEFQSLDEVMRLVNTESYGSWLLGNNGLWHGGFHISYITQPLSALNRLAINTQDPIPLQFMADGTIVAYRVNREYLTAPYCGQTLRFSSSFVLVKSQCKPDPQKENSWLEFYSLYLHLAAVSDYPRLPCYQVRENRSNIVLRKYTRGQQELPAGAEDKGEYATYREPEKTSGRLSAGQQVVVSRSGRFLKQTGDTPTVVTYGLARLLENGRAGKQQYWVTLDPTLMAPVGEYTDLLPDWLDTAMKKDIFDTVVVTDGGEQWQVGAGEAVGFMGLAETPGTGAELIDQDWYVHLEVLSTDANMPGFLSNPAGVKGGKITVHAPKGKLLHIRPQGGDEEFMCTPTRLEAQRFISREATTPVRDAAKNWWYKISSYGWLPQNEVEEIGQYDLLKQGFMALEENSRGDVTESHYENWVPQAFGEISRVAELGDPIYSQIPAYYQQLIADMDSNQDRKISAREIMQKLTVRDPLVSDVISRMVVKHHSEWFGGRSSRWDGFYKRLDSLAVKYCEKWQADLEWMNQVAPFNQDKPIWHMHPVMFLNSLKSAHCDCEELYADKFKVTRYGKAYGPIYKGNMSLKNYPRWDSLLSAGKLTLDEKTILIAMSENEGNMDSIQSYDSEVITAGAMQKIVRHQKDFEGKGELSTQLAKFKDLHPELYYKYAVNCGWSVEGQGNFAVMYYRDNVLTNNEKITSTKLRNLIREGCNVEMYGRRVHNKPLAALLKVITLPEYLDLQVLDFIEKLRGAEGEFVVDNYRIKDFIKSRFGRAIILDHSVNRPGWVTLNFRAALDEFFRNNAKVNKNPNLWGDGFNENERRLLEEYKLTRKMTDSIKRFNNLKGKL